MTEICAAMGLINMNHLDEILVVNERSYAAYKDGLAGVEGLTLIEFDDSEKCNRQYVVVGVGAAYPLSRDELIEKLHGSNVLARKYFLPECHRVEPYESLQSNVGMLLPVTEEVAKRIVVLPTCTAVSDESINQICSLTAVS